VTTAVSGPDVLLLPGLLGTLADWDATGALLRTLGYHPVAMDLHGRGGSGAGPWTWPAVLADLAAVAELLPRDLQVPWLRYAEWLDGALPAVARDNPLVAVEVMLVANDPQVMDPEGTASLLSHHLDLADVDSPPSTAST
jgi:hypothetical protein